MNPTQDNNQNITTDKNENHMISVDPVVKKVSKLKVFAYIFSIIVVAIIAVVAFYIFQNPTSIIKKALTKFDNAKLYQIDANIVYSDNFKNSEYLFPAKINLLAKFDLSSEKKLIHIIFDAKNMLSENMNLESKIIDSDIYLKINKSSIVETFLGTDLLNKWIYISKKDVENNPFGVNIGSTTTDDFKKFMISEKGMELIGIVNFNDSKIKFEDGKMIRKNYFDIDKDKLVEYIKTNIKNSSIDDSLVSMKESLNKTDINEAYIVTDFFDNSFKSVYLNLSSKATSSVQTIEISLKYDDFNNKIGLSEPITAPKDFTSLESIFKDMMSNYLR